MSTPQTRTPAQAMAVQQLNKPAAMAEREVKFLAFASDLEIRLTIKMVQDFICIPTKTGVRCTDAEAMKFMMLCQARRLNPWEGDAYLQGYDSNKGPVFSLITAHQAFLKRAEASTDYDGMESGVIVMDRGEDDKPVGTPQELHGDFYVREFQVLVGAWAKVYRKGRKYPDYRRLDVEVFDKGFGRWEDDPAGMIVKCAEADALRSAFPSVLGGLYLAQELNLGEKNITPTGPKIDTPSFITSAPALPAPTTTAVSETPERQTAREVTAPVAPLPGDDDEPFPKAGTAPTPAPEIPDVTKGMDFNGVITLLKANMARDGVTEDQVIAHLRQLNVANSKQKELAELSDSKLRSLATGWSRELPGIKAVVV